MSCRVVSHITSHDILVLVHADGLLGSRPRSTRRKMVRLDDNRRRSVYGRTGRFKDGMMERLLIVLILQVLTWSCSHMAGGGYRFLTLTLECPIE